MSKPPLPPADAAGAPEQAPVSQLTVGSIEDEYRYLHDYPCPDCGGRYEVIRQSLLSQRGTPLRRPGNPLRRMRGAARLPVRY